MELKDTKASIVHRCRKRNGWWMPFPSFLYRILSSFGYAIDNDLIEQGWNPALSTASTIVAVISSASSLLSIRKPTVVYPPPFPSFGCSPTSQSAMFEPAEMNWIAFPILLTQATHPAVGISSCTVPEICKCSTLVAVDVDARPFVLCRRRFHKSTNSGKNASTTLGNNWVGLESRVGIKLFNKIPTNNGRSGPRCLLNPAHPLAVTVALIINWMKQHALANIGRTTIWTNVDTFPRTDPPKPSCTLSDCIPTCLSPNRTKAIRPVVTTVLYNAFGSFHTK